jgi:hypothetical protein
MASDEPCEPPQDPQEHDPRRSGGPARWRPAATRWWRRIRVGITLTEIIAAARGNDALAYSARAVALLGDAVLGTDKDS